MSRSRPTAKNPATRFMQWKGGAEKISETVDGKKSERYEGGKLTWYDKEAQTDVEVQLPFSFLVLDTLHTVTGYSESNRSGFWSNEVRNLKNETLVVKTKQGSGVRTVAKGTYDQIKDEIKSQGGKYTQSVYIAYKGEGGDLVIGHIKISGAALTAWIEFQKKFDINKCAVFITDEPKLEKKGSNYYFSPVFDGQNVSDATEAEAQKLDDELQRYLDTYLSRKPDEDDVYATSVDELEEDEDDAETTSDEPAEEPAEAKAAPAPKKQDDDKINLADVPF